MEKAGIYTNLGNIDEPIVFPRVDILESRDLDPLQRALESGWYGEGPNIPT